MLQVCFNGELRSSAEPLFTAGNRSFKWGDGLFETMRVHNGKLLLESLHFDRLFSGLRLLGMAAGFTCEQLLADISRLCAANDCAVSARVRLHVYRTEVGGPHCLIEAEALTAAPGWNEKGLLVDIYPLARKSCDAFANIKSASYLPYVLAGRYAEAQGLDDALLLNSTGALCDTSRANIFLVMEQRIITPALDQGCVAGVMRRFLIEAVSTLHHRVQEAVVTEEMLAAADEVFLTNAIRGVQWVEAFRTHRYGHDFTKALYQEIGNQSGLNLL